MVERLQSVRHRTGAFSSAPPLRHDPLERIRGLMRLTSWRHFVHVFVHVYVYVGLMSVVASRSKGDDTTPCRSADG